MPHRGSGGLAAAEGDAGEGGGGGREMGERTNLRGSGFPPLPPAEPASPAAAGPERELPHPFAFAVYYYIVRGYCPLRAMDAGGGASRLDRKKTKFYSFTCFIVVNIKIVFLKERVIRRKKKIIIIISVSNCHTP